MGNEIFQQFKEILDGGGIRAVSSPQLFQTPKHLAEKIVELADIEPGMSILEPSAGLGAIIKELPPFVHVTAVEISTTLADSVRKLADIVHNFDFLEMHLVRDSRYDRVLMNPPFSNGSDIKHIKHALRFLKPGGKLIAICANGPRQRRDLMPISTYWEDLPQGTFKEAGTMVNAALIIIDN